MNELQAALRAKYGTPEKALQALGLDPSLLAHDGASSDGPLLNALKRTPKMAKLNATALRVTSAITGLLGPKLAADAAMPDLRPVVAGITRANFDKSKRQIIARTKVALKSAGLAADQAGPDDVILKVLEMVGQQGAAEAMEAMPEGAEADQTVDEVPGDPAIAGPVATDPSAAVPPVAAKPKPKAAVPGEEPEAEDEPDPEIMKALMAKCGNDAEMAKACYDICMGGATDEVVDPAQTEEPSEGKAVDEVPMMKPAMDAAINTAVAKAKADMRAESRAAAEARDFVRPWVGAVSLALDSADGIYEHTLKSLGVSTKGLHKSAFRPLLEKLPKPGQGGGNKQRLAQDTALVERKGGGSDLAKRFPHAAAIQVLG